MDTEPVSFEEFDDYLRDLERINILTLAYRPTLLWLKRALADFPAERPISVLDVGCFKTDGHLRRRGCPSGLKQPTSSLEWIRSEQILSSVRLSPITSEMRIWFVLSAGWTDMPRTAGSSTTCSVTS